MDASQDTASATHDVVTLRMAWPTSITATNVRFDERGRVILSSGVAEGSDREFALITAGFSSATWNYEMCHAGALLPWSDGSFLVIGQDGLGYRLHRVLRNGVADRSFGRGRVLSELPANFSYVFEALSDGRGGVWVFYRAGMEREVGATLYPDLS